MEELYNASSRRARDPDRQARGWPCSSHDRSSASLATIERTPTPSRLPHSSRGRPNLLNARARRWHAGVRRRQDRRPSCGNKTCDESHPTKSNVDGITQTEEALARARRRADLHQSRRERTCSGGIETIRRTLIAVCRTSNPRTVVSPDCSMPCVRRTVLILTSDHGCDPTTRPRTIRASTRCCWCYVQGKNAAGRIHEGEFADVGATVNAWLGGKSPRAAPRPVDRRALTGPRVHPCRRADLARKRRREADSCERQRWSSCSHMQRANGAGLYSMAASCMAVYFAV